jgi:hypothetical protein
VQTDIEYWFTVEGGTDGSAVPIDVTANLVVSSGSPGPTAYAFANMVIGLTSSTTVFADVCTIGFCDNGTEFHGTLNMTTTFGHLDSLQMQAIADDNGVDLDSTSFAMVDPKIFVDPSFPNASQYQIVLSSGVVNGLPTPEPSAWALLLTGFAALGGTLRRRPVRARA